MVGRMILDRQGRDTVASSMITFDLTDWRSLVSGYEECLRTLDYPDKFNELVYMLFPHKVELSRHRLSGMLAKDNDLVQRVLAITKYAYPTTHDCLVRFLEANTDFLQPNRAEHWMDPVERVVTVPPDMPIQDLANLLTGLWSMAIVIQKKRAIGTVSARDLIIHSTDGMPERAVNEIMSTDFHRVTMETEMDEIRVKLTQSGHKVAVVEDPQGKFLGIVTEKDVMRWITWFSQLTPSNP